VSKSGLFVAAAVGTCVKIAVASVVQFARSQHTAQPLCLLAWGMASSGHPMRPSLLPGDLQASVGENCLANATTQMVLVGLLSRSLQALQLVLQLEAPSAVLARPR